MTNLEPVRRRPTWRPGVEVELLDGHRWHFPQPAVVIESVVTATGPMLIPAFRLEGFEGFDGLYSTSLQELTRDPTPERRFETTLGIAAELLLFNYELSSSEFWALLRPPDDIEHDRGLAYLARLADACVNRHVLAMEKAMASVPPASSYHRPPTG